MVVVDNSKCTGCGMCRDSCPHEAIALLKKKAIPMNVRCVECGTCVDICPEGAIKLPVRAV